MNPEVKGLALRVHTRIDDPSPFQPRGQKPFELRPPKWSKHALVIDCETTTEELGQKLNFGFYRKCKLIHEEYETIEEGIIIADDLAKRFGQKAVLLLNNFAKHRADTVCGRLATIHVYTRSEFVTKVFFPWAVLNNAMVVGANLAFDLSVLSIAYHEHKTENGFSSELARRYKKREHKRYPRLRTVPKNSRTAFFELSGGTGPYKCGKRKRGRFLDVLTFAFAMRNVHYTLKSACGKEGRNVAGKLDHKPSGKVTLDEIKYCREDVGLAIAILSLGLAWNPVSDGITRWKQSRNMALRDVVAPPFDTPDLDGRAQRLGDQIGKVVLVNIWATWCEPCKSEMPKLDRLYRERKDQGFIVFGLSDEDTAVQRKFLEKIAVTYPLLTTNGRVPKLYRDIARYPAIFLIDRGGKLQPAPTPDQPFEKVEAGVDALLKGGS